MIIGVDCFCLVKGKGKSIGIYNFSKATLNKMCDALLDDDSIVIFGNSFNKIDFCNPRVKFVQVKLNPFNIWHEFIWENFLINSYIRKFKINCAWFPRGFIPLGKIKKCTEIVTIHDMIPFFYQEFIKKDYSIHSLYIRFKLKLSAKRADKIITISNYSKTEICRICGISSDKISVIYNAVPCIKCKPPKKQNYICAITSKLKHKNAFGIIQSYIEYCGLTKSPKKLVIVGIDNVDFYSPNISKEIKEKISCLGYIKSNEELYSVINNSFAFIFLSMAEGFGYPPIEAMQLGIPVICSNSGSLNEIVSDSGLLVKFDDYIGVAKRIIELEQKPLLYQSLVEKGYSNAQRFQTINQGNKYLYELTSKKGYKTND